MEQRVERALCFVRSSCHVFAVRPRCRRYTEILEGLGRRKDTGRPAKVGEMMVANFRHRHHQFR